MMDTWMRWQAYYPAQLCLTNGSLASMGPPKKLEQRFLNLIFQHWFPLLERTKDGNKLLPLVTSFALQSFDLFKHCDLIFASKNGFILKCWHWLLIHHFPTLTPSYDMFFKTFCLSNMLFQVVKLWANKKSLPQIVKQTKHFTCYNSPLLPFNILAHGNWIAQLSWHLRLGSYIYS
jgi:hypothetical protein